MNRLTIFAKGNLDLRDSLHAMRSGDAVAWNGINEILRARHPGWLARLKHEVWARSDALLAARCIVPAELTERGLPLDPYMPAVQFSTALFETAANVVVLSIQPDLCVSLLRHKQDGYLFYANNHQSWPAADRLWLRQSFEPLPPLDAAASMRNLAQVVARLRARTDPPAILVYNVSAVVPGEQVHCHEGLADIFSTRIRRFNLALIELSQAMGFSVIDVDSVLARAGADRLKLDAAHLTPEGCRLVAEEVARVLDDLGCFSR